MERLCQNTISSLTVSTWRFLADYFGGQSLWHYVWHYESDLQNLKAQLERLKFVEQRVLHKNQAAERNGEQIGIEIVEWLNKVDELIHNTRTIIDDEWKGNNRFLGGFCLNFGTRYRLGMKSARKVQDIVSLLSKGKKFLEISSRPIPEEISSLITAAEIYPISYLLNYKRYYENLINEVEKLTDAEEHTQNMMKAAERNGEAIFEDVLHWLDDVQKLVHNLRTFEFFELKANTRCFFGLCPDLIARYSLGKKAVKLLKDVTQLRGEEVSGRVSYPIIPANIWLTSTKAYENFRSRKSTLDCLHDALKDNSINIIGLHGMGGIGKTVLLKQVAALVEANKLFDVVIFVEVTPTPNIKKIQGDIADYLGLMFREETVHGRASKLLNRLKKERNMLVILDNIWESLDLRDVGIPVGDDHEGCKLLLTSRDREVVSKMGSQCIFTVGVLDEEEGFGLFKKIVGDYAENQEFQSLAIDIAKACGGLPIAIDSIAMSLRGKDVSTWRDELRILRRLSFNDFTGFLATVYSSIKFSYDFLRSEKLKSTFLLSSLVKHSDDVCIMELLKYGMGLGLFEEASTLEEAQNIIYHLVYELKSSSLLLDGHSSEWFTIHDLVLRIAMAIAERDLHALILRKDTAIDMDALRSCKAISIHDSNITELPEGLECPQLNFFSLLSGNPFVKIPENFFTRMTKLSVLKLTKIHLLSLPSSLRLLVNLRTLCFDQCKLGNIVGIGDLKNLEILSLSHSDIKFLPNDMSGLTRLRMLDVSNCSKLKIISPNVISRLCNLEELYMGNSFVQWEAEDGNSERRNASIDELQHLSKLTSLEIHTNDANFLQRDLLSKKLKRFKIFLGNEWDWFDDYGTSRTLKLKLNSSILQQDGIIRLLNGTEELYLDELQDVENALFELDEEGFPRLKHLHIQNNSSFRCIAYSMDRNPHYAFPNLESLFLHNLSNLEKVFYGQFSTLSFCNLKIIRVEKCDNLKDLFSLTFARGLPQLQTLEAIECKNLLEIFTAEREDEIHSSEVIDKTELGQIRSLSLKSLSHIRSLMRFPTSQSNEGISEDESRSDMPLFSERVLFPRLEVLELGEIPIEKIWHNRISSMSSSVQNLTHLILCGCKKLKNIFSSSISTSFMNLQHLEICHCDVLEEIIIMEELREEESNEITIYDPLSELREEEEREGIIFPCLECLVIKDLEKLTRFCSGNYIEFPSLKQLEIEQCPQFKAFIFTNIGTDSEETQPFFNGKVALPSLEEMVISGMDNLKMIWDSQLSTQSFRKLKVIEVHNCDNLLTILTSNVCERLWQLESLTVTACGLLEEIFDLQMLNFEERRYKAQLRELVIHGLPSLRHVWKKDHQVMLSFPKLNIVRVSGCQSLEYLFPASIAGNLLELGELEMVNCGVREIVSEEERVEDTVRFVFPRVTFLKLSMLQQLQCFYPGIHTSEWLELKKLEVHDCGNVKIFSSKFLSNQEINAPAEQPLLLAQKVFLKLEELKLGGELFAMIWQGAFPDYLFRKLEVLHILKDESDVFPLYSIQRFHNLEKLILSYALCREIFSHEEVEGYAKVLTKIKTLKLFVLPYLKYLWNQKSELGTVLPNLEILDVWWCDNLISLVPLSASFHNLTTMEVWFCKTLKNLVAFSTAKTLVQLKEMKICGCELMTEVVANEGDVKEAEIEFCKLRSLTLFRLQSLKSFCSGNYAFRFPCLEELFVMECPKINIFCRGTLSTPNLQEVQQTWAADIWRWDGDLNTTIHQLYKRGNAETSDED
ncbi:uncharacterized protein LOC123220334 [Mangifera indica]|uniref:uncharacterized protein LOC123220334 n=1 Tax=Mangifera indica TaxID=29780 RepID=UPI001CF932B4|nr:uncharacterized protein LOC123220334 [Mangifera indica]